MSAVVFRFVHRQARERAAQAAMTAPEGYVCRIAPPSKSREQEERYHAMIGEIAKQWEFCGRHWDAEDMKRLLVDQFRRDTKDDPDLREEWAGVVSVDLAPSIDRMGTVLLGIQTRKFSKKLASAFVEWLYAFGANEGVVFTQ